MEFISRPSLRLRNHPAAHKDEFGRVLGSALSGSSETSVDSDIHTGDDAGGNVENPESRCATESLDRFLCIRVRFLYLLSELTDVRLRPAV